MGYKEKIILNIVKDFEEQIESSPYFTSVNLEKFNDLKIYINSENEKHQEYSLNYNNIQIIFTSHDYTNHYNFKSNNIYISNPSSDELCDILKHELMHSTGSLARDEKHYYKSLKFFDEVYNDKLANQEVSSHIHFHFLNNVFSLFLDPKEVIKYRNNYEPEQFLFYLFDILGTDLVKSFLIKFSSREEGKNNDFRVHYIKEIFEMYLCSAKKELVKDEFSNNLIGFLLYLSVYENNFENKMKYIEKNLFENVLSYNLGVSIEETKEKVEEFVKKMTLAARGQLETKDIIINPIYNQVFSVDKNNKTIKKL